MEENSFIHDRHNNYSIITLTRHVNRIHWVSCNATIITVKLVYVLCWLSLDNSCPRSTKHVIFHISQFSPALNLQFICRNWTLIPYTKRCALSMGSLVWKVSQILGSTWVTLHPYGSQSHSCSSLIARYYASQICSFNNEFAKQPLKNVVSYLIQCFFIQSVLPKESERIAMWALWSA